jgi:hypothetical protein
MISYIVAKLQNDILENFPVSVISLMPTIMTSAYFTEFDGLYGTDFEISILMFF